jgi:hypothetical protein
LPAFTSLTKNLLRAVIEQMRAGTQNINNGKNITKLTTDHLLLVQKNKALASDIGT